MLLSLLKKIRLISAVGLAKLCCQLIKQLHIGGGTHLPGRLGLIIAPQLITQLAAQIPKHIIVVGTNGKTTTTHLLSHIVKRAGVPVATNPTGANLTPGIATKLCLLADSKGMIKLREIGIWEVDERAFNELFFLLKPRFVVFLNLFKDQLDRYGEVDTILSQWRLCLEKADWQPILLLNADNHYVAALHDVPALKKVFYQVKGYEIPQEINNYYPTSNNIKPEFTLTLCNAAELRKMTFSFNEQQLSMLLKIELAGMYQLYNICAALAAYRLLGLPVQPISAALQSFSPAFGRAEHIQSTLHDIFIFLVKNPTGANQVFYSLGPYLRSTDRFLLILNDESADGTDISWIWDADFEYLSQKLPEKVLLVVSGKRGIELAVRCKYAGIAAQQVIYCQDIEQAFIQAYHTFFGRLFILPTYTALLPVEQFLFKKKLIQQEWNYAQD